MNIPQKIKKAEQFAQKGQLDQAILILKNVIRKFPKQAESNGLLGLFYIFKKDYQLAEQHLINSIEAFFDFGVAKNLIKLFIQLNRWNESFFWSQKLVLRLPKDTETLLNHAVILRNINQVDVALNIYKQLINDSPEQINIYISYGFTLNLLEKYEEAIDVYQKGLKIQSNVFALLYNLGITYLNQFDFDNALKYLTLALNQNKQSIDLWLTIAVCQSKKRDFKAAYDSVHEAMKQDPNSLLPIFQMGALLLQQDRNKEGIEWLDKVITKDPKHVEANYHKGLIYLKQEKYREAALYYRYRVVRNNQRFGKFNDFELPNLNKESEILISWEQGIGDEILYLGLIKVIQSQVKSITYITQDKIFDWVKLNLSDIQCIKESESEKFIENSKSQIKLNVGSVMAYIENWDNFFKKPVIWKVDEKIRKKYLQKYKYDNQKILGISWMSANKKIGDLKSIPLNKLASIIGTQKTISLQYGDVQNEISNINLQNSVNIIHDDELDYFNDINSLAALISVCDIVVTCSNVTAHIAGRLGIKTYLMIPKYFGNIWYWNDSNKQSKWYPSVTIIKQTIDMSWDDPIQQVKKHLSFA